MSGIGSCLNRLESGTSANLIKFKAKEDRMVARVELLPSLCKAQCHSLLINVLIHGVLAHEHELLICPGFRLCCLALESLEDPWEDVDRKSMPSRNALHEVT